MKFLTITLSSVILASFVTFLLVHLHFTGRLPWEEEEMGGLITAELPSAILQETREIIIALPQTYSSREKYPVLYVLDGGPAQVRETASVLEVLATNGYAPETIVVGIPNPGMEARQRDLTPPYMLTDNDDATSALGSGDKFLEFMQQELIPFVDSHYVASTQRLLSGNSRGGLLVLHSLMTQPGLFQAHFCFSAPFWRQDEIILQKFNAYIEKADSLNSFLFFSVGEQETGNIKQGGSSLAGRLKANSPSGLDWNFQVTPKADHQGNFRQSLGRALGLWGKYVRTKD